MFCVLRQCGGDFQAVQVPDRDGAQAGAADTLLCSRGDVAGTGTA